MKVASVCQELHRNKASSGVQQVSMQYSDYNIEREFTEQIQYEVADSRASNALISTGRLVENANPLHTTCTVYSTLLPTGVPTQLIACRWYTQYSNNQTTLFWSTTALTFHCDGSMTCIQFWDILDKEIVLKTFLFSIFRAGSLKQGSVKRDHRSMSRIQNRGWAGLVAFARVSLA